MDPRITFDNIWEEGFLNLSPSIEEGLKQISSNYVDSGRTAHAFYTYIFDNQPGEPFNKGTFSRKLQKFNAKNGYSDKLTRDDFIKILLLIDNLVNTPGYYNAYEIKLPKNCTYVIRKTKDETCVAVLQFKDQIGNIDLKIRIGINERFEFTLFSNKRVINRGYPEYPPNEYTIYTNGPDLNEVINNFFKISRHMTHGKNTYEIYTNDNLVHPCYSGMKPFYFHP